MRTSIIRPGLLVSLKSTVTGGVQYQRTDLAAPGAPEGAAVARWETTRTIEDPEEHERAIKVRGKALGIIRAVCSPTAFGLLCPADRESDLDGALAQARGIAREHNDGNPATGTPPARCTRVDIYALKGRIASTDEEAARAIGEEVRSLLDAMSAGIDKLDPAAIRDAASRAASMGAMLGDEQIARVTDAVEQARKAARAIVKRVEKGGETAANVLQDLQRGAIERARFAFLDTDDAPVVAGEAMPAVQARDLDLDVIAPTEPAPASPDAPASSPADVTGESPAGESLAASPEGC